MSKNGVAILLLIASLFGLEITEGQALELLNALGTLVSIGVLIYNQYKRPDTELFLWKTKKLDEEL